MRVCPVCEGITDTELQRCPTCEVPMPRSDEIAFRESRQAHSNPWLGVVVGGKYRIEGILGKGGMGTVYRATHELSLAPVALKILHPRLAKRQGSRDSLIAEAQRASRLRGEHVARILDVGESPDGSIFIAMELVEGRTLAELLTSHGALPVPLAVAWLSEMAEALRVAHQAGVVHRDLSPSNVIVETTGKRSRLKIVDFGIAVQLGDTDLSPDLWVKPPYTAPELLEGRKGDERVDLFALGVIAFEMLTGRVPFSGGSLESRVRSVLEDAPEPWGTPGLPRRLRGLVQRLLSKDPEHRPASASAVLEELAALHRGPGAGFRAAALLFFLGSAFVVGRDLVSGEAPFLVTGPGARLALAVEPLGPNAPARTVHPDQLAQLPLNVGGLRGGELQVAAFDGRQRLFASTWPTDALTGRFVLDVATDPGWRDFVRRLEARAGPTDIVFSLLRSRAERPLAWSRLHVDVEEPRFAQIDWEPSNVLRIDSRVDLTPADDTGIKEVWFRLFENDGSQIAAYPHPEPRASPMSVAIGEVFANKRVPQRHAVTLEVELVDTVGRRVQERRHFKSSDFAIPEILEVRSSRGDRELRVVGGRTELFVRLSAAGDGVRSSLRVLLNRKDGDAQELDCKVLEVVKGPGLRVLLSAPPFPTSQLETFTFELTDAVGNLSLRTENLRFRNLDLDPRFEIAAKPPLALLRDRVLYLSGAPVSVEYRCNAAFVPSLGVTNSEGRALPVALLLSEPGLLRFRVEPGAGLDSFDLVVRHFLANETRAEDATGTSPEVLGVQILRESPELRVPSRWLSGQAWVPELLDANALERVIDGYSIGLALEPPIPGGSELRGSLWRAGADKWQCVSRAEQLRSRELRRQIFELGRGRQRLAVELQDVLGRPLRIRDESGFLYPTLDVQGHRLAPILDFRNETRKPQPLGDEILVAWKEDVLVRLEDDAEFSGETEIRLLPPEIGAGTAAGYLGRLQVDRGQGVVTFTVPFAHVARWCGWDALGAESFLLRSAEERNFEYRSPAGQFSVQLRFRPTRSLLRAVQLSELAKDRIPLELDMQLVPFRGPEGAGAVRIGVERSGPVSGTLLLREALEVTEVGDYFLASTEVSREAYQAFLAHFEKETPSDDLVRQLGHVEDPLGARRFTRENLLPRLEIFGSPRFEDLVAAGPKRPVTGLDYFQAHAFCRWLGWRLFGDADSFRLPFAAELEWAALGELPPGARNGLRRRNPELADLFRRHRRIAARDTLVRPDRWPATPAELRALGDHAPGLGGSPVHGLEFGVREWCEDVPALERGPEHDLFRSLARSLREHRKFGERRRTQLGAGLARVFQRWLRLGVVRGVAWAEPTIAGDPALWLSEERGPLRERVMGVKRQVQIERDGSGLTKARIEPMLQVLGMRVAGSRHFIERVRSRVR